MPSRALLCDALNLDKLEFVFERGLHLFEAFQHFVLPLGLLFGCGFALLGPMSFDPLGGHLHLDEPIEVVVLGGLAFPLDLEGFPFFVHIGLWDLSFAVMLLFLGRIVLINAFDRVYPLLIFLQPLFPNLLPLHCNNILVFLQLLVHCP